MIIGKSQFYSYRHYTVLDGLVQNQVMKLYQDKNGYIWAATKVGVSRFDGKIFKNYSGNSFASGFMNGFFEFKNNFYCSTSKGISMLVGDNFKKVIEFSDFKYNSIKFNADSTEIWLVGENKIKILSKNGIKTLSYPNTGIINSVYLLPKNQGYYIFSQKGMFFFDNNNKATKFSNENFRFINHINNKFLLLKQNEQNILKIKYSIVEYDGKTFKNIYEPNEYIDFSINEVLNNNKEIILIQGNLKWLKIDFNGNIIDGDSLPETCLNNILQDNKGFLWIGTENGLYQLQSYAFRNYNEKNGMPKYIWSIFEDADSNVVFASFYGKLSVLKNNRLQNTFDLKQINKNEKFYMNGFCNSLQQWMIPTDIRIFVKDKQKINFIELYHKGKITTTLSCYEDTLTKTAYFGTTSGVFKYNLLSKKQEFINVDTMNILSIEEDKYQRLWFCSGKQINLFKNNSIVKFNNNEEKINVGAMSCKRDPKGNMWLSCKDGIYIYYYSGKFKVSDGSYIFISLYKNKYIIAGSLYGILFIDLEKFYKYDKTALHFFDKYNGFIGVECAQNGTCVDTKGNVWIPTSESVVKFTPNNLFYDTIAPITFINSFQSAKSDWVWKNNNINNSTILKLDWLHNNVRIYFHAISYLCPERVKYKYRLIGYDNAWVSSNDETVIYSNLKHGNYNFEVLACNENGYWSKNPKIFAFSILPAFWQTWWFMLLMILIFISLIAIIVYKIMKIKRTKEIKNREIERELINMQINTINSQIDPHFVFNAITAIGAEVQENNSEKAYNYFVKVSHLLRSSLKNTGQISKTLAEEIEFVTNYLTLQKLRFGNRFDYKIDIAENIDTSLNIPKMCIQIFVENALKHGLEHKIAEGLLTVKIYIDDYLLHVFIEDNGVGRKQSTKYNRESTGIGLSVFRNFFEITNKFNTTKAGFEIEDLENDDGEALGTNVHVYIPLDYKYNI